MITASADHPASTITVREPPPGIRVEAHETTDGPERSFDVNIDPNLAAKNYPIAFDAFDGRRRQELLLELAVQPPSVDCPEGWRPAQAPEDRVVVAVNGPRETKIYPRVIEREVRDGAGKKYRVFALLIEQRTRDQPAPFYIMRDKVWVGLFQAYAHANRRKVPTPHGSADKDQEFLPVLGVPGPEAAKFAEWLGGRDRGRLPTCQQWDQAAGKNDGRLSPFPGTYVPDDPAGPAVGASGTPRAVNRLTRDISARGCRDMSGNGLEWTRLPPGDPPDESVSVRGQNFRASRPFTFKDAETDRSAAFPFNYEECDYIGFRVVIELE
jgi:hypothetical protein